MDVERPLLAYLLIVLGIVILARLRAYLNDKAAWQPVFKGLGVLEIAIISLLLATLIFFGTLQIVLRNFFQQGIVWADPLMRHIVLWLGCLGGVLATAKMRHINIDVLGRLLPERYQPLRNRVVAVATALATSVIGFAALKLVLDERAFGETDFLSIPTWILQSILPIAFMLITYRALVNFMLSPATREVEWDDFVHDADAPAGEEGGA